MCSPFRKERRIVNTLSSRHNFFASHKNVIRVGIFLQTQNENSLLISEKDAQENSNGFD